MNSPTPVTFPYTPLLPVAPPLPLRCPPLLPEGSVRGVQSVQPDVMTKCEYTVLLETQEPCGKVRKCNGDTETDDRSVQGKCHIWFQKTFHAPQVRRCLTRLLFCLMMPNHWDISVGSANKAMVPSSAQWVVSAVPAPRMQREDVVVHMSDVFKECVDVVFTPTARAQQVGGRGVPKIFERE